MRKLVYLFLLLLPIVCHSQEALTYSEVIQVEGVSKKELYNRAKIWFVNTFNSANNVLQLDDPENGQLIGKALFSYNSRGRIFAGCEATKGTVKYSVKVYVKEGRYKYEVSNFIHDGATYDFDLITTKITYADSGAGHKWANKVWKDIKSQIGTYTLPLVDRIKEGMNKTPESSNDDW